MLCWGSNKHGQLGLGGVEEQVFSIPTENKFFEINKKSSIRQISCGYNHTLLLLNDGTLLSCGSNDMNQLGHDDGAHTRPEIIKTLEIHFFVQIACGHSFSLALNNLGQIYCWGSISGTRDGDLFFAKPTLIKGNIDSPVVQIACGYNFFLALTEDGKVVMMGLNDYGQLGTGSNVAQTKPCYLKSLQGIPVQQITCGAYHSIVLTMSGNIFAFGKNR
jgi:E3 ubiquitin-protein ligase HERC4